MADLDGCGIKNCSTDSGVCIVIHQLGRALENRFVDDPEDWFEFSQVGPTPTVLRFSMGGLDLKRRVLVQPYRLRLQKPPTYRGWRLFLHIKRLPPRAGWNECVPCLCYSLASPISSDRASESASESSRSTRLIPRTVPIRFRSGSIGSSSGDSLRRCWTRSKKSLAAA